MAEKSKALIEGDRYLQSGIHIGTRFKSGEMRRFIYRVRKDGLNVFDISTVDEKIAVAAKFIAQFPNERIAVVARKLYASTPVKSFADAIGAKAFTARFVPGTFTNPTSKIFFEPRVVIVTESEPDSQAIEEATRIKVPVVALCSTNNSTKNVDIVVPMNNKGRKSLALAYWLLATEILKAKGEIKADTDFPKTPEDFEYKLKEGDIQEGEDSGYDERGRGRRSGFKGKMTGRPGLKRGKPESGRTNTRRKRD
ncbi:MAG: 30S ribosomal protein S2 [Candidatus Diapherotrites archaeon]